jgi:class 3 adenylate cyclase/CheY-like chemotaxis protein
MSNADDDDVLAFAEEDETPVVAPSRRDDWKLLVVDDEEEVHTVTKLALKGFEFQGRRLTFFDAYSAAQAIAILEREKDIAVILLDVVMESDDAGFRVVKHVRDVLQNNLVRIILRTGQPGRAPEKSVIVDYDINDYKAKTELTAQKLFTSTVAALRSYRDVQRIDTNRLGLERIIDASVSIFQIQSIEKFLSGMVLQISSILGLNEDSLFAMSSAFVAGSAESSGDASEPVVLAGIGRYASKSNGPASAIDDSTARGLVLGAFETSRSVFEAGRFVFAFKSKSRSFVLYLESESPRGVLDAWDQRLIELFCSNFAVAYDNLELHEGMSELNRAYGQFAPSDAVRFLGKKSITDVRLGQSALANVAVMFLDLRGFTAIAERMTPDDCLRFLNSFLAHIGPCVDEHHGVINKYLGDGFMALFDGPDGIANAAACAGAIRRATETYNRAHRSSVVPGFRAGGEQRLPVDVGIGISAGPVILGTMGFRDRIEFTVLGDTVNTASRIEGLTKHFGAPVLVTESFVAGLPSAVARRRIGRASVIGKARGIELYELFDADEEALRAQKIVTGEIFDRACRDLEAMRYDEARVLLDAVVAASPEDRVARYHLEHLGQRPPHAYSRRTDIT